MKKIILLSVTFLFTASLVFAQTKIYNYPVAKPIVSMEVPTSTWSVSIEDDLVTFQPNDDTDTGRLIAMIWKSDNPYSEDAVDVIIDEAFELVEEILVDLEWKEESSEFEINGIEFAGIDGWGNYVNNDGSKDEMMVSVSIFLPDNDNICVFVFFGLNEAYDKHGEEFLEIMMSLKPSKK
jgi:hypothetical protein